MSRKRHAGSGDTSGTKIWSKALPETLPILGLSDIVIFPGTTTPLVVETPQSIRLIDDVVAGDRFLGLVLQRNPDADTPTPADLWLHGCAGRVRKMLKFPDGMVRILVEGLRRFRIREFVSESPYLVARVEKLKDVVDTTLELAALTRNAAREFQEIVKLSPTLAEEVKVAALNEQDPAQLADLIAANLNLSLQERQHLLELPEAKVRLSRLLPLLSRELEVLRLGSKIQNEVVTSMSKNQRDFFLREQIRAIQRELGEVDSGAAEVKELREQVEQNQSARGAQKDRAQGTGPPAADAAGRGGIHDDAQLPGLADQFAVVEIHRGQTGFGGRGGAAGSATFRVEQSQGPAAGVSGGHQTQTPTQRPHSLPGRPARRGKNLPGQERGGGAGPEIRAHFPGRDAG